MDSQQAARLVRASEHLPPQPGRDRKDEQDQKDIGKRRPVQVSLLAPEFCRVGGLLWVV